jgi:uncharacterized protein
MDRDLFRPESHAILWDRLDLPGHDAASAARHGTRWWLQGTALFKDGDRPVRLDYHVDCAATFITHRARITGQVGLDAVAIKVERDGLGHWTLNDVPQPAVDGCPDVDLAFTPATNFLAIRRLGLRIGESGTSRAAWLRYPEMALEPLDQVYRRTGDSTYDYESGGGAFRATLRVDASGFVTDYPDLWTAATAVLSHP